MFNDDDAAGCFAGLAIAAVLICFAVFVWAKTSTYDTKFTAVNQTWERVYHIQNYQPRYRDTERSQMPSDAYGIQYYTRSHSSTTSYSCGTSKAPRTCTNTVYWTTYHARYYIDRWEGYRDIWTRGTIKDEIEWPDFSDTPITMLGPRYGDERLSGQEEFLWDNFKGEANHNIRDFRYRASSGEDWRRFPPDTTWGIKVNRLDEAQWDTIQKVNMQ